jgi:hypothetical protein
VLNIGDYRDTPTSGESGRSSPTDRSSFPRRRLRERWFPALMQWLFALSKFELVLLIVSTSVPAVSALLLLEVAGVAFIGLL